MEKSDAKKKRSKLLVNCSALIQGTKDFKLSSFLEKYKSTRFRIYKDEWEDVFIKIAFNDVNNTKESLIQYLDSDENREQVLEFHFYKTWKEIQGILGFENHYAFPIFQEKKLKIGGRKKRKKS